MTISFYSGHKGFYAYNPGYIGIVCSFHLHLFVFGLFPKLSGIGEVVQSAFAGKGEPRIRKLSAIEIASDSVFVDE